MLAISISNEVPVLAVEEPRAQAQAVAFVQASQSTSTDTVKLSQNGQIHALEQQGEGISEIANWLNVTVATVDSALGITVAAPAAADDTKTSGATASTTSEGSAAAVAPAAPVGMQAGPTPAAQVNVTKG